MTELLLRLADVLTLCSPCRLH